MKIIEIIRQHRRDFIAIYECQNCKNRIEEKGYDDRNFHDKVVPKMKCKECGESTNSLGLEIEYVETKYPEGKQV